MNIDVPWETLRKRKLFIATPMYGGMCTGQYMRSMCELTAYCQLHQIHMQTYFIYNESLITRARNELADYFLNQTDCTHLMFIDSDIGFNAKDVIALMALQSENPEDDDYDIISGPYPKKCISWEKVIEAVNKGAGDEDPSNLENYIGDFVFNPVVKDEAYQVALDAPVEISEAGTGFMMIRRSTLERFRDAYPELKYRPDNPRSLDWTPDKRVHAFFDTVIEEGTDRYLSEDFMFCHYARNKGMKVWLCPWMRMIHFGTYAFNGSLIHLASIGADATSRTVQEKKMAKGKK